MIICDNCKGQKRLMGFGMIWQDCAVCSGVGSIYREEIKIPEQGDVLNVEICHKCNAQRFEDSVCDRCNNTGMEPKHGLSSSVSGLVDEYKKPLSDDIADYPEDYIDALKYDAALKENPAKKKGRPKKVKE